MSQETLNWLNSNTLIGFTGRRGNAWHYRAEEQGDESNHYVGPIPVPDVLRRLFAWQAEERPLYVRLPSSLDEADGIDEDGTPYRNVLIQGRKGIVASDNGDVLGIFGDGYRPHQYGEWLLNNVATILGDELAISSAGLLRNRAVAWVEVSVPDNITTPEGVEFRPNLVAATSFDGSLATTYKRNVTAVVCDNTLAIGLAGHDQRVKIRHSSNSLTRIEDVRHALALVHDTADLFAAEVKALCEQTVTTKQWHRVLDALVPVSEENGIVKTGRGLTMATKKRDQLQTLYAVDPRVAPWAGTAFGVLQAFNTHAAHLGTVKNGVDRGQRNMDKVLLGRTEAEDAEVLKALDLVCA